MEISSIQAIHSHWPYIDLGLSKPLPHRVNQTPLDPRLFFFTIVMNIAIGRLGVLSLPTFPLTFFDEK